MELTPQISEVLNHLQRIEVFQGRTPLQTGRKNYETMAQQLSGKKETVAVIEELSISADEHQIPVRLYRPRGIISKSPAIIYIHGGWFISGGFETHDAIARQIANATGAVILFVDYRLAPEHPFPAGLNDCKTAAIWLLQNADQLMIDDHKIGIIGDSAGGTLAAALAAEMGDHFKFQVLIYPAADNQLNTRSWEIYRDGPVLNKEWGMQAWKWYLTSDKDQKNPSAIPSLIKNFKETPPTLVILAEHDPLRDEGELLAQNMKKSGVLVKSAFYKDMVHGFIHMGTVIPEVQSAVKEIAAFANQHLEK